jgi:uroporphyrinogen III methyltransferase/synthase
MVYLIGAGPGDPGLITARGLECLRQADVVLYDRLVHPRLLGHAPGAAERIEVGVAAPQPLEQEAICYLIAEKAREGKTVARLKWGDPFVFDHGGTEALFLHEQHIPFEVVPGVPAGIAAASYAGVPLTYPGSGDTLTFVRGHEDLGKSATDVDWASLARLDGAIVCYAGPEQLATAIDQLLTHGRSAEDPAAVIYDGTLPTQETVVAPLSDLARSLVSSGHRRPGVLVVGRVAGLREHLRWFDARPLFGRRILVTRPKEQAAELSERLEALGAEAIELPMIQIVPPDDYGPLDEACARVGEFDWIVFTSGNAVDAFMERLFAASLDARALGGVKLCVVGPATRARLASYALRVDMMPAEYRAETLAQALTAGGDVSGLKVFLPRADIGREVVASELRRQGAIVTEATAYRTVPADPDREGTPDIYKMLLERQLDAVTFTSASAVRNCVRLLGEEPAPDLLGRTVVAAIGPVTADAAAKCHVQTDVMPGEYTIPALVDAIVQHFRARPS